MAATTQAYKSLTYPLDLGSEYKSKVAFSVIQPVTVIEDAIDKGVQQAAKKAGVDQKDLSKFIGSASTSEIKNVQTVPSVGTVMLYLPTALQFQDGVAYENVDLGVIGAGAEAGVGGVEAIVKGSMDAIGDTIGSLIDSFKGPTAGNAAKLAAVKGMGYLNDEVAAGTKSRLGVTMNPNSRTLFKQPNIRNFSFTFKMIAKSQREAEEIEKIVNLFRTELYPDVINGKIGDATVGFGYKFPNKFQIKFYYDSKEMTNVPKIKPCYLTAVNTVFNSGSMAMHSDGRFLEVDITLAFTEERALNKSDILAGY